MRFLAWMLVGVVLLAACGGAQPAVREKNLPSPIVQQEEQVLDPSLLDAAVGEEDGKPYKVGPGDVLLIIVFGHPELAVGTYAAGSTLAPNARTAGLVIDNDGTIELPLIGPVQVAGKTSAELSHFLEEQLKAYVKEPRVLVQVIFDASLRFNLLGEFAAPGLKFADRPMRLLDAIALGGSVLLDQASLRGAYVARGDKRLPVNFFRLLKEGDMRQNIRIRTGDTIFVPDKQSDYVFVFGGAVGGMKGGPVPMVNGRLDLLQALAMAGIGYQERAQGRLDQVRIIRGESDRGKLFTVDAERILRGEAALFPLAPGDIVFVPESGVTKWNQVISQLLPSLQTISALLNPFVSIKYLSQ